MKSWYLVYSKIKQESIAQLNLDRQGYETYLPLIRNKKDKSMLKVHLMFPRYLFIRLCNQRDDWAPIRSTIGVMGLVRFNQWPAQVSDKLIESLKKREDQDGFHVLSAPEYKRGDKVRIINGPFEHYEAIFYAHSSKDRVILLLQEAEKSINLKLDKSLISLVI
jgi:transcriptional antiterminator RfaH